MTTHQRQRRFTADAFMAWAAEQPQGRFELWGGEIVAMSPERIAHTRAKFEAAIALRTAIATTGLGCEAIVDGVSVRIDDRTVFEPDALVRCGPKAPGDATAVSDPLIVVEVVSPSSRGVDAGAKLAGYFQLPSVRHYLLVDTEARVVIHHRRDEAGAIAVQILRHGSLVLDPPAIEIDIGDIFAPL
ncbi:MAG: Uma2 family endonuclease [Rhodobacteraceae bacterium]|nr:Uma2 family endonuclease [Paracoccaceae bacterium]